MKDQRRSGFSRRAFLRGSGAAAAATALAAGPGLVEADDPAQTAGVVGPEGKQITLNVNGKDRQVQAEPRTTLMDVLRYQLQLTGCKPVSIDASSGASTVLVDDKPVSANSTLAMDVQGKKIRTVESLGGQQPDLVVQEFVHNDGMQCGFCTPGFVVAVRAFLDTNPAATEDEIRSGLNGNLCRCGTYADVIEAALAVVKGGSRG